MNTDIRVDIGFLDHWKTEALIESCGPDGVLSLLRIWVFAAQNKPNGELTGIPLSAIERVAKWKGEKGSLQKCLEDLRFIEQSDGHWCLHDWKEHNPYAANAEWRRNRARKANAARWGRKDEDLSYKDATSKQEVSSDDPPSPAPSPAPSPIEITVPDGTEKAANTSPIPFKEIVEYLNKQTGASFRHGSKETIRFIKARWGDGFKFDDFAAVIDSKSAEWKTDPKMVEYLRPQTLFGTKFESYLQAAKNGRARTATGEDAWRAKFNS